MLEKDMQVSITSISPTGLAQIEHSSISMPLNDITTNTEANVIAATVSTSSNISPQNNEVGKGINTVNNGNSVVASSLQLYARSRAIKFTLRRLKPNTKFYAFIDGRSVSRYICQDVRFTGIPANSLGPFGVNADGSAIKSDANGDASGLLIFPAGPSPSTKCY